MNLYHQTLSKGKINMEVYRNQFKKFLEIPQENKWSPFVIWI